MQITEAKAGYFVEYLLQGTAAEVEAEIFRLKDEYPPEGYGTRVKGRIEGENCSAVVQRSANCE